MSSKKPSVKDRAMLAIGMAADIQAGSKPSSAIPRTGPGAMMAHLARESDAQRENDRLRDELSQWDGATPAKRIDPALVVPSKYANRLEDSFSGPEFGALKDEIRLGGGNIQPIKVRPLAGGRYEIVFGHRRHRACLELGLPVLAIIESIDERTLFAEMDRENRQREDLRPYEQGEMYRKALDSGLFPSLRSLADAVGVDVGNASKAVALARLHPEVLAAFPSRLELQFRWATALSKVIDRDPDAVLGRARQLMVERQQGLKRSAAEVFSLLVSPAVDAPSKAAEVREIVGASGRKATWKVKQGRQVIEIDAGEIPVQVAKQLEAAIKAALS